jgi:hypothetical protein
MCSQDCDNVLGHFHGDHVSRQPVEEKKYHQVSARQWSNWTARQWRNVGKENGRAPYTGQVCVALKASDQTSANVDISNKLAISHDTLIK